jgi:hypothetical protein
MASTTSDVPGLDVAHLEREGWAIIRGVVDADVCDRGRACIDGILGPAVPEVAVAGRGQADTALEASGSRWPDPDGLPLISSGGPFRTKVMHPIRDRVVAELVTPLAPIFERLYRCEHAVDLKLLQHMFTRTDALPAGYAKGSHSVADAKAGAGQANANGTVHAVTTGGLKPSYHMDDAFLEEHRLSTPVQMYYHCMLALTPVRENGAPYLVCPGSMQQARRHGRLSH